MSLQIVKDFTQVFGKCYMVRTVRHGNKWTSKAPESPPQLRPTSLQNGLSTEILP